MTERIALVTGGVRGLGLAVARRLAADGDRVHVVYRSSHELAREREAEFPGRVHRTDATDPTSVRALFREVAAQEGRLDVLVHAVGDFHGAPLSETSLDDWRATFASNVDSAVLVAGTARHLLRESGGVFLAFGFAGLDGLRARRRTAAYAAAKSALAVFVRSFAREEASYGVRANLLSPGWIPHEHSVDASEEPATEAIPLQRPGTPEEVADAAAWLCSDAARYVTGVDLPVAGGWGT